ncbi:NAD-dependent epimerase/dehydratase family protein [Sphingomonas sp. JC676]|uniref:NAD-dependent epimerase/dehydratase family protein n=1 Tax=Sphingomonas sp. JC676 TaxID=2768065 RepID=UPI001CA6F30B|nr:NAD-dependent epimerase/dehydratase family protein [Sphingomonas sp. JC676]
MTGGTGFVAGWCIVELLRQGFTVRATLRNATAEPRVRAAVSKQIDPDDRLTFAIVDLTRDAGWEDAMASCDHVLHIASPLGRDAPRTRDALVAPARDGSLRVLRAAIAAGVDRVVMTSAAATARPPRESGRISDESIWADPDDPLLDPYRRSKILAERAAWEFMETASGRTTLTTILPGAVFGPILENGDPASVWVIGNLLKGRPARLLNMGLAIVDVRDLAKLHIDALTAPEAPRKRFLATGEFLWMTDIARILREGLGERAAKVPDKVLPNWAVRALALFMPQLRMFAGDLGQRRDVDTSLARDLLGFAPRPARETLIDCAETLLAADVA